MNEKGLQKAILVSPFLMGFYGYKYV
jgi:hypothetical protein